MRIRRMAVGSAAAALLLAGCTGAQEETDETTATSEASLSIIEPASGTSVEGNVVTLDIEGSGVEIVKADGDTSGRTGHYHVFIDRDPVAPGEVIGREAGIVHTTEDPIVLPGLSIGRHRLAVVYGDGTHQRLGDALDETNVEVKGPSIDATAPATVAEGQPVIVEVELQGFSLAKADGDTSGRTGHLHVFVDRPPTPAGQPIPVEPSIIHSAATSIEVPGLDTGEHALWVVAGDGTHVPLAPAVMDKVTVTVTT